MRRAAACQVSTAGCVHRRSNTRWCGVLVRLLIDIAVHDFGGKSALRQQLLHRLREHYRALFPAGASEADGQITFSLAAVMLHYIGQQALAAAPEFPGVPHAP